MILKTIQRQSAQIRLMEALLHDHMALYGYEYMALPIIELADIFLTRAGDKIIERLFTFDRFGQQLALRPEFTAAAAHLYIKSQLDTVARWQFSGAIFEDEPDDHTLEYQQYSIGAECIGLPGSAAEAEAMAIAAHGIAKLGLDDWQLVIGHVGLQLHLLSRFDLDRRTYRMLLAQRETLKDPQQGKATALAHITEMLTLDTQETDWDNVVSSPQDGTQTQQILDVLLDSTRYGTTMGGRTRHDIAQRLLNRRERVYEQSQITAALDLLSAWVNLRAPLDEAFSQIEALIGADEAGYALLQAWRETIRLLEAYGIRGNRVVIQADLTKNWEYYTGLVFGIQASDGSYIVGGGRYDELTRVLGSPQNVPAVGFAYYVDKLLPLLPVTTTNTQPVIIRPDASDTASAIYWANVLRDNQIPAVIDSATEGLTIYIRGSNAYLGNTTYTPDQQASLLRDLKAVLS